MKSSEKFWGKGSASLRSVLVFGSCAVLCGIRGAETRMTGGGLAIVIEEGTHEDWVGGVRTLDRARPDPGTDTEASGFGGRARPRRRPCLVPARRGDLQGGGRRGLPRPPATSAPVDHASRTGWGRTVRLLWHGGHSRRPRGGAELRKPAGRATDWVVDGLRPAASGDDLQSEGRDTLRGGTPWLPPRGRRSHVSQTVVCDTC